MVQEAMLRVWTNAPRWQPLAALKTWLTRVVVNLCLDRKRRPQPVELEAAGEMADSGESGFELVQHSEQGKRVAAAMAKLPERQRAALALCYYEEMGNIEAAKALDISVGALESLLVRGRRALRDSLGDLANEGAAG